MKTFGRSFSEGARREVAAGLRETREEEVATLCIQALESNDVGKLHDAINRYPDFPPDFAGELFDDVQRAYERAVARYASDENLPESDIGIGDLKWYAKVAPDTRRLEPLFQQRINTLLEQNDFDGAKNLAVALGLDPQWKTRADALQKMYVRMASYSEDGSVRIQEFTGVPFNASDPEIRNLIKDHLKIALASGYIDTVMRLRDLNGAPFDFQEVAEDVQRVYVHAFSAPTLIFAKEKCRQLLTLTGIQPIHTPELRTEADHSFSRVLMGSSENWIESSKTILDFYQQFGGLTIDDEWFNKHLPEIIDAHRDSLSNIFRSSLFFGFNFSQKNPKITESIQRWYEKNPLKEWKTMISLTGVEPRITPLIMDRAREELIDKIKTGGSSPLSFVAGMIKEAQKRFGIDLHQDPFPELLQTLYAKMLRVSVSDLTRFVSATGVQPDFNLPDFQNAIHATAHEFIVYGRWDALTSLEECTKQKTDYAAHTDVIQRAYVLDITASRSVMRLINLITNLKDRTGIPPDATQATIMAAFQKTLSHLFHSTRILEEDISQLIHLDKEYHLDLVRTCRPQIDEAITIACTSASSGVLTNLLAWINEPLDAQKFHKDIQNGYVSLFRLKDVAPEESFVTWKNLTGQSFDENNDAARRHAFDWYVNEMIKQSQESTPDNHFLSSLQKVAPQCADDCRNRTDEAFVAAAVRILDRHDYRCNELRHLQSLETFLGKRLVYDQPVMRNAVQRFYQYIIPRITSGALSYVKDMMTTTGIKPDPSAIPADSLDHFFSVIHTGVWSCEQFESEESFFGIHADFTQPTLKKRVMDDYRILLLPAAYGIPLRNIQRIGAWVAKSGIPFTVVPISYVSNTYTLILTEASKVTEKREVLNELARLSGINHNDPAIATEFFTGRSPAHWSPFFTAREQYDPEAFAANKQTFLNAAAQVTEKFLQQGSYQSVLKAVELFSFPISHQAIREAWLRELSNGRIDDDFLMIAKRFRCRLETKPSDLPHILQNASPRGAALLYSLGLPEDKKQREEAVAVFRSQPSWIGAIPDLVGIQDPAFRKEFCPYEQHLPVLINHLNQAFPFQTDREPEIAGLVEFARRFGIQNLPRLATLTIHLSLCQQNGVDENKTTFNELKKDPAFSDAFDFLGRKRVALMQTAKQMLDAMEERIAQFRKQILEDQLPEKFEDNPFAMELFSAVIPKSGHYGVEDRRKTIGLLRRTVDEHRLPTIPSFLQTAEYPILRRDKYATIAEAVKDGGLETLKRDDRVEKLTAKQEAKKKDEECWAFLNGWNRAVRVVDGWGQLLVPNLFDAVVDMLQSAADRLEKQAEELEKKIPFTKNEKASQSIHAQIKTLEEMAHRVLIQEPKDTDSPDPIRLGLQRLMEAAGDKERAAKFFGEEARTLIIALMRRDSPNHFVEARDAQNALPDAQSSIRLYEAWKRWFEDEYIQHFTEPTSVLSRGEKRLADIVHFFWRTNPETCAAWRNRKSANVPLPRHPLGDVMVAVEALQKEIDAVRQNKKTDRASSVIAFHPCMGLGRVFASDIGDACFDKHADGLAVGDWKRLYAILTADQKDGGRANGSTLLIDTENKKGERVLVIRALNPTEATIYARS